ncbi:MAG: hypothetical protein RLP44_32885 [Aggregatilineales bacterium]
MLRKLFALLLLICLTCFSTAAQDDDTNTLPNLTLTGIESVGEFIDGLPHNATLSPDGNLLVYEGGDAPGLCVYNFTNTRTTCTPYPEEDELGERIRLLRPTELKWSPDSRFVALTENSLVRAEDSDIWIYDVDARTFTDRTQDGYSGSILLGDDFNGIPIDVIPIWSPDGSLYFFRYIRSEDVITTQLFTIPASGGSFAGVVGEGERTLSDEDPSEVADYTESTVTPYAFYNGSSGFSLSGAAEVSPDGTQMALLMRPLDPETFEIWIVSLLDGSIVRRISASGINALGLPEWGETRGFVPEGITWMSEDELVVNFINYQYVTGISWTAYHIDLITDKFTPIFDFASIPSQDEYFAGTQTDSGLVTYPMPRYAAVTPEGDYFLYVTSPNSINGAALEALPILGGERIILHQFGEDFNLLPSLFTSIGTDGETVRALIFSYIFTFEITE